MTHLTENEKALLNGIRNNDFTPDSTWVFAAMDAAKIDYKVGRGVLSSLVKKGLVEVDDNEGKGRSNDMFVTLMQPGHDVCREHGITSWLERNQ